MCPLSACLSSTVYLKIDPRAKQSLEYVVRHSRTCCPGSARMSPQDSRFGETCTFLLARRCGKYNMKQVDYMQWIIDTSPTKVPWSVRRTVHEIIVIWFSTVHTVSIVKAIDSSVIRATTHCCYRQSPKPYSICVCITNTASRSVKN